MIGHQSLNLLGCDNLLCVVGSSLLSDATKSIENLIWSPTRPWGTTALGHSVVACDDTTMSDNLLWLLVLLMCNDPIMGGAAISNGLSVMRVKVG